MSDIEKSGIKVPDVSYEDFAAARALKGIYGSDSTPFGDVFQRAKASVSLVEGLPANMGENLEEGESDDVAGQIS